MFSSAFVTGATGLLGNNLVRELAAKGVKVKGLARSRDKALKQFGDLPHVEIVEGDMADVAGFAASLEGVDVLFHTAAYFRQSYEGGSHWAELKHINVDGARALIGAAYAAGIRRMVHTSSVAVLDPPPGKLTDETMLRKPEDGDDYIRSKILADAEILEFLEAHQDMHVPLMLPGWMHGPRDIGPTSAGRFVLDYMAGKLPGIVPGTFSMVDARDVALAQIAAAEKGRSGERYLAAGRHITMADVLKLCERVSGIRAPTRKIPVALLYAAAAASEVVARFNRKPVLLSMASVRFLVRENDRTHFDHAKSERELGISFRPLEETLRDEIAWYRANGYLPEERREAA